MFEFEKKERLGIISMNKPPANGYDAEFFNKLLPLLKQIEADKEIAVVLLQSAVAKFFSAGADIKVFSKNTIQQNKDMVVLANQVAYQLSHSSKIYVAFLNGHTLGGGLELAMACDIRIATDKHFLLGLPEINLGLMPGNGGIPRLTQLIGASRAFELIVSGNTFTPQQGYHYGLINQLFEEKTAEEQALDY
ncbi:MAG: enoyl-CoA hydratase/isomerase family protein, partial [Bacteroidota bacterium]